MLSSANPIGVLPADALVSLGTFQGRELKTLRREKILVWVQTDYDVVLGPASIDAVRRELGPVDADEP